MRVRFSLAAPMYLEDYLFEVEVFGKRYPVKGLANRVYAREVPAPIEKLDVYMGGEIWATGSLDSDGRLYIENQELQMPPGGIDWSDVEFKISLNNVNLR